MRWTMRHKNRKCQNHHARKCVQGYRPGRTGHEIGNQLFLVPQVFKEYTGYAPAKYFQELKLRKAKQLLIESSMSVKEICYELNYTSTEHFFSVFKKRTNFTPTEYRNFGRGGKEKENENE